ncbi:MAG: UDP-N-acetylglucosamine--N-acetylmuramyl-(pentapeptide) pyrophosphoryl-undecaprenol N-acetylglucosamine transferase, partial [candidate division WOR-3 bacterium]|nr:UDP-N-acetylglucosamine--N-acetylmuramyl-(pentapeptide) pyrophosphoryl-undecaprenol N-acetylglucosamine transferase [candidate division WOR-3 bacterium]
MKTKILIITGGTGGHLYPALAIAEAIAKRNVEVIFVTRKNPNDIEIIKRSGFKYYTIPASGFMTKNLRNKILSLFNLFLGTFVFLKIFWTIKPQFLIASGCYVSVVPLIWATIFKIQFYLLEQNVIPGRVVKYFSRYAKEIFLGFPLKRPIRGNTFYSGNPLREQIIEVAQNFNWDTRRLNKKTILILGGSQGTAFLNLVGLNLAAQLPQLHFILLTGKQHYNDLQCQSHIPNCELID